MKIVTADVMRREDLAATEKFNIPGIVLMENAASETVNFMEKEIGLCDKKTVVVCGGGNNGGDGLAIARKLFCKGYDVQIYTAFEREKMTDSAMTNLLSAEKLSVPFTNSLDGFDIIVEALLGIGITGNVRENFAEIISEINRKNATVISVDIPAGVDSDSGDVCGTAVFADYTVTMAYGKPGLFTGQGKMCSGKVIVADISLPPDGCSDYYAIDKEMVDSWMPEMNMLAHKGSNGTVAVAAGSVGMTGAAALCCMGALRNSAGIVKLFIPRNLNSIMEVKLTEAMTVPANNDNFFRKDDAVAFLGIKADCIVIGPGIGRNKETVDFVLEIVKNSEVPVVVDADGIYALSMNIDVLKEAKSEVILTPHPGEFSRLTGVSVEEINKNRVALAKEFAQKYNVTLLLKGPGTVVAEPEGTVYINTTGNEGMAKGGSGDVLSGIIGAFVCRGALHPGALGCYVHGKAGDIAAEMHGKVSMLPSDILNYIAEKEC